jgi:hypothetical protein
MAISEALRSEPSVSDKPDSPMTTQREFDLREVGAAYERGSLRPRRLLLLMSSGLGVAFAIAGAYFYTAGTPNGGPGTFQHEFYLIMIAIGAFILVEIGFVYIRLPRPAYRLVLDSDGIQLTASSGLRSDTRWGDLPRRISIADWRSLPERARDRALRDVEFVIVDKSGIEGAIPGDAARMIIEGAADSGLGVSGWIADPQGTGPARDVRFASAPSELPVLPPARGEP